MLKMLVESGLEELLGEFAELLRRWLLVHCRQRLGFYIQASTEYRLSGNAVGERDYDVKRDWTDLPPA